MIIYIKKRYWLYHENSDCLFKATREEIIAGANTMEGSFCHELGPVIDGSEEEGKRLLDEYSDPDQYRSEYFPSNSKLPPIYEDDLPF